MSKKILFTNSAIVENKAPIFATEKELKLSGVGIYNLKINKLGYVDTVIVKSTFSRKSDSLTVLLFKKNIYQLFPKRFKGKVIEWVQFKYIWCGDEFGSEYNRRLFTILINQENEDFFSYPNCNKSNYQIKGNKVIYQTIIDDTIYN